MNDAYSRPVALLVLGDAPPFVHQRSGNYDHMFSIHTGLGKMNAVHIRVHAGEKIGDPSAYSGAVLTGSPAMVTDKRPWSEYAAGWLREALVAGLPLFGVCYGHQLMAHAFGGKVGYNRNGLASGTCDVLLTPEGLADPLTGELPARFPANLAHSQSVAELPDGAVVLARAGHDPHHLVRYAPRAVGAQFHPEFDESTMKTYLDFFARELPSRAGNFAAEREFVKPTPEAAGLIARFLLE